MRIWELVGSAAEAVKRHAPDVTPAKNACTTAYTKIAQPVKSACRNSYDCGSAAFAKIDHTVRTVRLRRRAAGGEYSGAYEKISGEEVEEREPLIFRKTRGAYEKIPGEEVEEGEGVVATPSLFLKTRGAYETIPGEEVEERERSLFRKTRGAYEKIPGEVEEQEGVIATPAKANGGGPVKSVTYSYAFLTFAKIGYTVRVKVVYRIVQWISDDGTNSSVTIYATNLAHESDDGGKFILGDQDTEKNESKNLSDDTTTFAKMVDGIKEWMSSPITKSRIIMYTAILGENVRVYGLQHGLTLRIDAFLMILTKSLIDIVIDLVIEKADSREQHSIKGSQEFIPGVEKDDQWYSSAFKFLKEKFGVHALRECLVFMVKEFGAFLRMEAFRPQCFSKGAFTVEYSTSTMRRFLEFVKKRHCGAGFFIIQAIIMAAMRNLRCAQFVNEGGFHGSVTKGYHKKKNMKKKK